MSSTVQRLAASALFLGAVLAGPAPGAAQEDTLTFFRIGTGPTATTSYSLGTAISLGISKPPNSPACDVGGLCGVPGLIAVAQTKEGGLEAIEAMVSGDLESAIVPSDVAYWSYSAGGPYRQTPAVEDLRVIANLMPFAMHIVVDADSGIDSIADLVGKRVSLGTEKSGTLLTALNILDVHNIGFEDIEEVYLKPGPAEDALVAGQIDAFFHIGAVPDRIISHLAAQLPIRILPIGERQMRDLIGQYPFIRIDHIPSGAYTDISAVTTISITAKWVTMAHQPDDLIRDITRALWRGETRGIYERNSGGNDFADELRANLHSGVPLHPGAEAFYNAADEAEIN